MAILSRVGEPHLTRTALPGDKSDAQSRYIEAAVSGILIGCLYAPNGNPQPGAKVRLQTGVARTSEATREQAHPGRCTRRPRRRLQRRTHTV